LTALADASREGRHWYDDLARRLMALSGEEVQLVVSRKGEEKSWTLPKTGFDFGDRIVGTTDPEKAVAGKEYDPFRVLSLPPDPRAENGQRDPIEFRRRLKALAGKPVVIQVRRSGAGDEDAPVGLFVPPAFHNVLGARMAMGEVAAVRQGSAAEKVGLKPRNSEGNEAGDKIQGVFMVGEGDQLLFAAGEVPRSKLPQTPPGEKRRVVPLDPVRLPSQLAAAARLHPGKKKKWVTVIVPRPDHAHQLTAHALEAMEWDASWDDDNEVSSYVGSPLAIPQLGIAYWVTSRITDVEKGSPAARARRLVKEQDRVYELVPDTLQRDDVIYRIRWRESVPGEPSRWSSWVDLKSKRGKEEVYERWASTFRRLQGLSSRTVQLGIRRYDEEEASYQEIKEPFEVTLEQDTSWPLEGQSRGLLLMADVHLERASSMREALSFGVQETWDFIRKIYLGLSRVISGRVSTETFGGPIEIVSTTFQLAEDPYRLLGFLAVLSINLAVVNFLPIPLLDGGHMVFLIYEKLRGKPASEGVRAIATYIGLAMLLTLMVYVFYLDGRRQGWWP
jgi:regulator of sigma E protease